MIETILAAWVTTILVIVLGIGVVRGFFRLMGPNQPDDYE